MDFPESVRRFLEDKHGVSPVISTIIIVAVAIAISIAVALYLTGITGTFTRFERLDVTSAYADIYNSTHYLASEDVKNSGTSVLTIDRILINGRPTTFNVTWTPIAGAETGTSVTGQKYLDGSGATNRTITIATGDGGTIGIYLNSTTYKSGQSMEITFHSVGGKEYPKVLVLP